MRTRDLRRPRWLSAPRADDLAPSWPRTLVRFVEVRVARVDANSGSGDDQCASHVCCALTECPPELATSFDPARCALTDNCRTTCEPLVTPECDCMGCCTLCEGASCVDVYTNPYVAPACAPDELGACPRCTKRADCGPLGGPACTTSADCPADGWCARGTCIQTPT